MAAAYVEGSGMAVMVNVLPLSLMLLFAEARVEGEVAVPMLDPSAGK